MAEKSERAQREEKILQFWKDKDIFNKTLNKPKKGFFRRQKDFVFYDGPPTANGKPGIHHIIPRAFKDAIPRYKTMQGFRVLRKAGWDTHGLPVEIETEKQLGLKSKKEIEEYGVAKFNEACKQSVWKYIDEWRAFTERTGYWLDLDNPYVTYRNGYIENVWKVVAEAEKKNLLYKDYKIIPWCSRCGTALSSHELAQGYQDVKDLTVYAKFKIVGFPNAYFLAWTTTPWTLPGNTALAVGGDITYVEAKVGEEILVLAKDRLSLLVEPYEIVAEHKGSEMVGMEYEPLYKFAESNDKSYKIYSADFVNTEDGTGIVHIAPMYGQDDFELATKVGLPKHHLVDESGHFISDTGFLAGKFVKDEETAVEIIKDLAHRGLLFKKEKYEHSYPHCWRCKTPVIYYARDSWYLRMSALRDKLVSENKKINWEPEYIKEGRFGEWLREVKDWAISRERYWGTPLPVWESADGERLVVDSVEMLKKYIKTSGNTYFVMRHGEAESNVKNVFDYDGDPNNHITEKGRKDASKVRGEDYDLIFVSPFLRTQETAQVVGGDFTTDDRLRETGTGESGDAIRRRVAEFIFEIDSKHKNKRILLISHGRPIWCLENLLGLDKEFKEPEMLKTGELRQLSFTPLPHNSDFELDLHKPYIDEVVLVKEGKEYKRTKEVMDVWFDSGAVPFASGQASSRADFIAEGIDQTRGWFYTMHAVGAIMGQGRTYDNVICLGLLLDKEGKKMSKSVGNVVDPWEMMDMHGADALRLWMYSVNQPGESKNFDEKDIADINRRTLNILDNVYSFYEMYRDSTTPLQAQGKQPMMNNVLDQWILARLSETSSLATERMDSYQLLEPVRAIRELVDDLSTWYLRRSRERLKEGSAEAQETLGYVLKNMSLLLAPFAPFYAEDLYQKVRGQQDPESVHLSDWPKAGKIDRSVLQNMARVRSIVSAGLEARSKANIKVRQPLANLKFKIKDSKLEKDYLELIKDEVNVKDVVQDVNVANVVELDTHITPELEAEGQMRDIIRTIQDLRKERGLKPDDLMKYEVVEGDKEIFTKYGDEIKRVTNIEF